MKTPTPLPDPHKPGPRPLRTALIIVGIFLWFVFALDLMVSSLEALGEPAAEFILQMTSNPFTALFIGLLSTAMIQSSSTTTSLVVALVVSGSLSLENAVPVIMGANIGTTITSTVVSLGFIRKKKEFRRAVAAGTYHDFFNILTVALLFPLEYYYQFISQISRWVTRQLTPIIPSSDSTIAAGSPLSTLSDWLTEIIPGLITPAIIAFVLLFSSILVFRRYISGLLISQSPQRFSRFFFRSNIKAFFWGLVTTAAIRSSTITTSVVVPLVAQKITTLRRAAPFIAGANLGTTITAILAALLNFGSEGAISIAITHFSFNLFGIVVFYITPPFRELPFLLANRLGRLTLKYRLTGFVYLLVTFFFVPFSLIFFNQNPTRSAEAEVVIQDLEKNEARNIRIVIRQNRNALSGAWVLYDRNSGDPARLVPVMKRENTVFIGNQFWIIGKPGTCWSGSDSLGNFVRCVEKFLPQMETRAAFRIDSVYVIREDRIRPGDTLIHRYYLNPAYPLMVEEERVRNGKPEWRAHVIRLYGR